MSCKTEPGCGDPLSLNFDPNKEHDVRLCDYTVEDLDGNLYDIIRFNNKYWFVQNLEVTRLKDGSAIKEIQPQEKWAKTDSIAFCSYSNSFDNKLENGLLYNYMAVKTRKLCPEGRRVPNAEEWIEFAEKIMTIEDSSEVGVFLKSTNEWPASSKGNNKYGWSVKPTGGRSYKGEFIGKGYSGYWWSQDAYNDSIAFGFTLTHANQYL